MLSNFRLGSVIMAEAGNPGDISLENPSLAGDKINIWRSRCAGIAALNSSNGLFASIYVHKQGSIMTSAKPVAYSTHSIGYFLLRNSYAFKTAREIPSIGYLYLSFAKETIGTKNLRVLRAALPGLALLHINTGYVGTRC